MDTLGRSQSLVRRLPLLIVDPETAAGSSAFDGEFGDERLRLVFTCCHPALSIEARVALTLRLVCGLATTGIARLFLVPETTMARRVVERERSRPGVHESPDRGDAPGQHDVPPG